MNLATKGHIHEEAIADLSLLSKRPEFKKLLYVPQINWVITLSCIVALAGWVSLSYLWLNGHISAIWVILLSTYTFFIFILTVHEASHLVLSRNKTINDWLGNILTLIPYPHMPILAFRHQHLTHHRDTCGDEDPDDYMYQGIWFVRVLKVFTQDIYWVYWSFKNKHSATKNTTVVNVLGTTTYIGVLLTGFSSSYWYEFTMLYFVPQRIGIAVAIYMFAYVQHRPGHCTVKEVNPFKTTSIIRGFDSAFAKVYFGQNRHLIHHIYPSMPIYRNWRAWQAGKDVFERQNLANIGINSEHYNQLNRHNSDKYLEENNKIAVSISAVNDVADSIKSYTLIPANYELYLPEFTAGSHIDVHIKPGLVRQYSLCNAPGSSEYMIAVQKEGQGGSAELHESFMPGQKIIIGKPRNLFALKAAPKVLLFAGGIGITPILSMAWKLHNEQCDFELHYCIATENKWAFKSAWEQLPFSDKTQVYIDDQNSDKLDTLNLMRSNSHADVYVCGPQGFINHIESNAKKAGLKQEQFNKESFTSPHSSSDNKPFTLSVKGSDKIYQIPSDKSIVDVLKADSIFIPISCENGVCGTCKCKVVTGEVLHKDIVLNDDERSQQKLFTPCVSRAKNEHLTIQI